MNYTTTKVLSELLPRIKNKGLSSEEFMNTLMLKKSLNLALETFKDGQIEILKEYGVKEDNGNYVWKGHEQEIEISKDIESFLNTSVNVNPLNFMSIESFANVTQDLEFGFISYLEEYLLVK